MTEKQESGFTLLGQSCKTQPHTQVVAEFDRLELAIDHRSASESRGWFLDLCLAHVD